MRLKELRKAKGMQQQEAAKELNIPGSTYSHYELNEREPRIDVLIKLADYFDVSVDYLIGHEKTPNHVE
ncbi:helix-turn-helix domain-containing protein [Weissella paramesenteroides]|uniref:helix-turn-helix domain-containing protein n=1 Tax=Weissella paramesenteroides TaxID=1249 RepID=UPI002E7B08EE|nr:helix-turn-helix transcriptional regulator [Weissella paramesenteroides]WPQ68399.1 helix-turn-helix transcriptional regulator [Weissella paramesenteroides]